ncbi:1-deoxy-D-xylulose-5-phosphate synthase [Actinomycetota bacterium]|nr:1-deoxy-D-xylulose-5-phosphate synthase [Actinomycetota bacterium]
MFDGISGFPKRQESIYDAHDSGHASDSLSIASGLAKARDLDNSHQEIVAVIGDASLSGGLAFEALNQIGHDQSKVTIVLNDNEMSISKTVGALSLYLSKARMSKPYMMTRDTVESGLGRIGKAGRMLVNAGEAAKNSFKKLVVPGMFFEDMGIKYIGPIDGHNIADLRGVLTTAKQHLGPVLIHIVTKKGRGYAPAEKSPELFHGIGSYDPDTGEVLSKQGERPTYTTVFAQSLIAEADKNPNIVAITAGMEAGTGLSAFKDCFPSRFIDVGIAEEHAVAQAAGLALGGKTPVVAIYSTFLQRAFDQIVIDVALQQQHVVFCVDRSGLVGEDGSTHHGALDLAYLRSIPNMRIIAPAGAAQLRDALHTALQLNDGPVAIRYPRGMTPDYCSDISGPAQKLPFAKANKLRQGNDVAILALGDMVPIARQTADLLADQGLQAAIYDMLWVKPLDAQAIAEAAKTKLIITIEDGTVSGGFGSAVLETIAGMPRRQQVLCLGLPDSFVTHGATTTLFEQLGLTPSKIATTIKEHLDSQTSS